jgi:hypothetical protein
MTSQLMDVLALPSQDGRSVTLRARVTESSALYDGAETTPTESQQTWRYTLALEDTPVISRRVDAGAGRTGHAGGLIGVLDDGLRQPGAGGGDRLGRQCAAARRRPEHGAHAQRCGRLAGTGDDGHL